MTREIREGIEIILFDNSIKGRKYQKDFTELAEDIMRMESEKGVVIRKRIGSDIQGTALFSFESLIEEK